MYLYQNSLFDFWNSDLEQLIEYMIMENDPENS